MNCENNIKIANYIGMEKTDLGWFDSDEVLKIPNESNNTFDILRFDSDWNWLLSVVYFISYSFDETNTEYNDLTLVMKVSTLSNDILRAYNELFIFIVRNPLPIEK